MILYCSLHHGPPEPDDKVYELWDGRKACMACIVEWYTVAELGPSEHPMTAAEILCRLYGPKQADA